MSSSHRQLLKSICLLIVSLALTLFAVELGLRFFDIPKGFAELPGTLKPKAWTELLHRHSSIPGLSYELVPNMEKFSHGAIVKTNSYGMRDDEPIAGKPDSLIRIVVIGDSGAFGFGVSGSDTYSNVLERLLNASTADTNHQYEVLNLGVGGYSTRDEAIVLRYKALVWDPDLVIVGYAGNDPEIESFQPLHSYFRKPLWWQHSSVLRLVEKARRDWDLRKYGGGNYVRYLHTDPHKWMSVVEAFRDMKDVASAEGFQVVVLVGVPGRQNEDIREQVSATVKENGFHVIDLFEVLSASGYKPVDVFNPPPLGHFSKLGNRLIAEAIRDRLLEDPSLLSNLRDKEQR